MGRPPAIDRQQVLDAAEAIVRERGAAGLTMGAVATAAGISKGGMQSCFGNKDGLLQAMHDRWNAEFDGLVSTLAGPEPTDVSRLAAHIRATRLTDQAAADRSASLLTTLLEHQGLRAQTRAWYAQRLAMSDPGSRRERRARLAFLATEGAFLLRSFGFLPMDDGQWEALFGDLLRLAGAQSKPSMGSQDNTRTQARRHQDEDGSRRKRRSLPSES